MNGRERYEAISEQIDIIKSFISTIKKHDLVVEYRHEIEYFKSIIRGLIIDLNFKKYLKNGNREIFLVLYKEHLKATDNKMSDMEYIEEVFARLYDNKHQLRNSLFYMDCIPAFRPIIHLMDNYTLEEIRKVHQTAQQIDRCFRKIEKENK